MPDSTKSLADDLRRVVIFSHLLSECADYLTNNSECIAPIASACQDLMKAKMRLFKVLWKISPNAYTAIVEELDDDRISDLIALLDLCIDVDNMGHVLQVIRDAKTSTQCVT